MVLRPKKLKIRKKIVRSVKEPKKLILSHEIESNPWKDKAIIMDEGDDLSY
jgi:hypothetical protein